jgi:hypothetical protein
MQHPEGAQRYAGLHTAGNAARQHGLNIMPRIVLDCQLAIADSARLAASNARHLVGDGVDALEERVLLHAAFALQDFDHLLARERALQLLSIEQLLLKLLESLRCD